jgi:hypothetical protein
VDQEYIQSGRFIHDELLRRCERAVAQLYDLWRKDRHIFPTLLLWPNHSVQATNGERFSGVVFSELPEEVTARKGEVRSAIARCDAYGVLVTEQLDDCVRVIFESPNGTRTWRLQIKDHGDAQILGRPTVSDNTESVGVLWKAN